MSSPTLALKDLFRLAFSSQVIWLSEPVEPRPNIRWVVFSVKEAQQGDLLILTTSEGAAETLQRARQLGVAAALFLGDESLPEESIPEGLTVAMLPGFHDPQDIQRALLTILINQRAALIERSVAIHTQLSQLAAEDQGLVGLAAAMADISGRGIIVQDKRLGILAERSPQNLSAKSIWEEVLKRVMAPETLPEALRDRKQAALHAVTIEQEINEGITRLVTPIIVGGMARGYLSLVGPQAEMDALDHMVAEQGALVCAVEMSRTKAVREAEKRLKGDLLNAILQENISPRDAELWVQGMDLDLAQAHLALRFAWDAPAPPSRRRLETLVNGEISRRGLRAIVSAVGTEIVCFCEIPSSAGRPEIAIALGQAVIDQGTREYPDKAVLCGIGTAAKEINEWRSSFRQAGQALELARRFRERKSLYFPDLSVYRLLIQIEHSPELIAFQEETLGPLLASDGGRELIRTLESYFQHNGNLSQTAEALYIHRNTLIYRMERIATITGLNLDNPETRLAVQLALHIYRMMGNMRG